MTNERYDVDILHWDLKTVWFSKPIKTEDSLFGRMYHYPGDIKDIARVKDSKDPKEAKVVENELIHSSAMIAIHLDNVEVLEHKIIQHVSRPYTMMLVRVNKKTCKKFLEFDQFNINQVKNNLKGWFSKALDTNVIEEYYMSSIQLSNDNTSYILKVKTYGCDELLKRAHYDLVMTLRGVRFYKQRFVPEWELTSVEPVENDFLNSFKSDDDASLWEEDLMEQNVVPEPDIEALEIIRDALSKKIRDAYDVIDHKVRKYEEKRETLQKMIQSLAKLPVSDVKGMDKLSIEFDEFEANNYRSISKP